MRIRFYFILGLALRWAPSLPADILYSVVDLGTFGGSTTGTAINNAGQVTGVSQPTSSTCHAFLYSNGQMMDLGAPPAYTQSVGRGINDLGQVTGTASRTAGNRAFLYSNGQTTVLGTLGGTSVMLTASTTPGR